MPESETKTSHVGPKAFPNTRWSVVLTAGRSPTTEAQEALSRLCEAYWYPLYAFVRRKGYQAEDAQDLTQEFFRRLLEQQWVSRADQQKGKFRSFLLMTMNRFLADEWDKARAQKRGGGQRVIDLNTDEAERQYEGESRDLTADKMFDRRWAITLLENTINQLRLEYASAHKKEDFEKLKVYLTADHKEVSSLAESMGISEGNARVAIHRLRKRYREIFREQIACTVADPSEVDEELRYLIGVLSGA